MPLNLKSVYPSEEPKFVTFPSRRSVIHSTDGIVSCTQPLAARCGQKILDAGGNAAVSFRMEFRYVKLTVLSGCGSGCWYVIVPFIYCAPTKIPSSCCVELNGADLDRNWGGHVLSLL